MLDFLLPGAEEGLEERSAGEAVRGAAGRGRDAAGMGYPRCYPKIRSVSVLNELALSLPPAEWGYDGGKTYLWRKW